MDVLRERFSGIRLLKSGERCRIATKTAPVSGGTVEKNP
jgi:hypothetical protein